MRRTGQIFRNVAVKEETQQNWCQARCGGVESELTPSMGIRIAGLTVKRVMRGLWEEAATAHCARFELQKHLSESHSLEAEQGGRCGSCHHITWG